MLVQLTSLDPIWSLFTLIGILTLFGKKKKDEKDHEETGESSTPMPTSAPNSPVPSTFQVPPLPASAPAPPATPPPWTPTVQNKPPRSWPGPPQGDEDSSLSRLLQSLLRDLPSDANSMGGDQPGAFSLQSTAEWAPPRATPTSRPMMISPGGKKGPEPDKPTPAPRPPAATAPPPPSAPPVRSVKPSAPMEQLVKEALQPKFYPPPSPDKPEKPVREEAPKRPSPSKVSQGFEHIFELTKGNLESPGLVGVNGSQGSGKTTLCAGLANSFLKEGDPCMFVTYDKAPAALRDQMKKKGADPSDAESQYRFLLVDGLSNLTTLHLFLSGEILTSVS